MSDAPKVVDEKMLVGSNPPGDTPPVPTFTREIAEPDVPVSMTTTSEFGTVTSQFRVDTGGRRDIDDTVITLVKQTLPVLFWIFGLLLEPRAPHKPSITRVSWFLVLDAGLFMFGQETTHYWGNFSPSNAAWQAWALSFGACSVAVFGPKVADYWKNGASQAAGTIATALRDPREPSKKDDERKDT